MSINQVRDGRSLLITYTSITFKQLRRFGLSVASAKRAMRVRRILPFMEDSTIPCIDARRLWSQLGKPYKRFRDWADHHIKPLLEDKNTSAEISALIETSNSGSPTKNYTLSRNIAAHLAMLAKTAEGWEIRSYFIDMERVVFHMAQHNWSRATVPSKLDRRLHRASCERFGRGNAVKFSTKLQTFLCEVLTGLQSEDVRKKYGKRIRDILEAFPEYQDIYNDAYAFAVFMYECNIKWDVMKPLLKRRHGGKIDLEKLLAPQQ